METGNIEYLIENAEQGSGDVEIGKAARQELEALVTRLEKTEEVLKAFAVKEPIGVAAWWLDDFKRAAALMEGQ